MEHLKTTGAFGGSPDILHGTYESFLVFPSTRLVPKAYASYKKALAWEKGDEDGISHER